MGEISSSRNNPYIFSKNLRDKMKKIYVERSGKKITDGEADLYLDRLMQVEKLIAKIENRPKEDSNK
ncbi:MAG: hypothetical protein WC891_00110 [Actinomycetota bacterium]